MSLDWWTLGLQTVNIVILMWLLQRFFWKPIAAMIAERRAAVQKALSEAQAARDQAKRDLIGVDTIRAGFAQERQKILDQAREDAQHETAAKSAASNQQVTALLSAAKAQVEVDKVTAAQAWATRSSDLAVDIARRLATRLEGPVVQDLFLDWALKAVRALPASTRANITDLGSVIVTTSATQLDPAEQTKATQSIGEAFGAPVRVVFETDPDLIAGLELRTQHLVVTNSWRADLAKIVADLAHDK